MSLLTTIVIYLEKSPKSFHSRSSGILCLSQGLHYTWRDSLGIFFATFVMIKFLKIIVIPFADFQKLSLFQKFGGFGSKIEPAMLISILNFSRVWQSYLVGYALKI